MRTTMKTTRNEHGDERNATMKLNLQVGKWSTGDVHGAFSYNNNEIHISMVQVVGSPTVARTHYSNIMARKQRKSKSKTAVEVSDEPVVASPAPMPVEPEKKGKRGAKNGASATNGFG